MILSLTLIVLHPGPLGLYGEINDIRPRVRDSYTSYATENTDYLTYRLCYASTLPTYLGTLVV